MSGEMAVGRSAALSVGFSVGRASNTSEVVTEVFVDISDLADGELDLPSRLSFSAAGLPFFEARGVLSVSFVLIETNKPFLFFIYSNSTNTPDIHKSH